MRSGGWPRRLPTYGKGPGFPSRERPSPGDSAPLARREDRGPPRLAGQLLPGRVRRPGVAPRVRWRRTGAGRADRRRPGTGGRGAPEFVNVVGLDVLGPSLLRFGTEQQRQRHIPPILDAREIWCQGFSEPEAGSDLASLRTRAATRDGHFVLSGQKTWVSWGQFARWCGVLARTEDAGSGRPRHRGISMLIVDMNSPGVDVRPMTQITGHAEFCELFFDDVLVPEKNLLSNRGDGWKIAMYTLGHERGTAALPRQVKLRTWLDRLAVALGDRALDGRALLDDPGTQVSLAQAMIGIEVLRYHAQRTVGEFLSGGAVGPDSSSVKLLMAEAEQRLAATAVELLGPLSSRPGRPSRTRTRSGRRPTSTPAPPRCTAGPGRFSAISSPTASSRFRRSSHGTRTYRGAILDQRVDRHAAQPRVGRASGRQQRFPRAATPNLDGAGRVRLVRYKRRRGRAGSRRAVPDRPLARQPPGIGAFPWQRRGAPGARAAGRVAARGNRGSAFRSGRDRHRAARVGLRLDGGAPWDEAGTRPGGARDTRGEGRDRAACGGRPASGGGNARRCARARRHAHGRGWAHPAGTALLRRDREDGHGLFRRGSRAPLQRARRTGGAEGPATPDDRRLAARRRRGRRRGGPHPRPGLPLRGRTPAVRAHDRELPGPAPHPRRRLRPAGERMVRGALRSGSTGHR